MLNILLPFCWLLTASAAVVPIKDGNDLVQNLCSVTPSDTTFLIIVSQLHISPPSGKFCLVSSTTNITIAPTKKLNAVSVQCGSDYGFGFFNVTNLTIRSVSFVNCETVVPKVAVSYINTSSQFFYYNNTKASLIFNHCSDIKLHDILVYYSSPGSFGIIGVNLCGRSEISAMYNGSEGSLQHPALTMLIYYMDTNITAQKLVCNLSLETNIISTAFDNNNQYFNIKDYLSAMANLKITKHVLPVTVISGFALYLAQGLGFSIHVNIHIKPIKNQGNSKLNGSNILIMFVNNKITNAHVTFQGNPYEYCEYCMRKGNAQWPINRDQQFQTTILDVVFFHNTYRLGNISGSPLTIQNTSFVRYSSNGKRVSDGNAILRILKIATNFNEIVTSYNYTVVMERVSWCGNTYGELTDPSLMQFMFHAESVVFQKKQGFLMLQMKDIAMCDNHKQGYANIDNTSLVQLISIKNATMMGGNYFAHNAGGSVINLTDSGLIINGTLKVSDGFALQGGGIRMDDTSTLYFQEPLVAVFSDNRANYGSAIYAPICSPTLDSTCSPIQIVPIRNYSPENVTKINITLLFENNLNLNQANVSMYAPQLSFFGNQKSDKFLFDSKSWDNQSLRYIYTNLFDTIIKTEHTLDKFSSLSNGICITFNGNMSCRYLDQIWHDNSSLSAVHLYPGQVVFSVLVVPNNVYEVIPHKDVKVDCNIKQGVLTCSVLRFYTNNESSDVNTAVKLSNNDVHLMLSLIDVKLHGSCPLGFNITKGNCTCMSTLHNMGYDCDIISQTVSSPFSHWTGLDNATTILISTNCPPNYCDHNFRTFTLNNSIVHLSCLHNRTGVLCGQCRETYSAVFGSDACLNHCTDLYLLTIPVYALAGFLLVVILFVFRLTVATGTINGAIFYANVLGLTHEFMIEDHNGPYMTILHTFVSLLNLNLGFPLCLYQGMTTASKIGFQFVFPMYLWSIVIGLIVLSKYYIKLSNLISNHSVQVLATLFYLCFSKLLQTVISIVSFSKIHSIPAVHNKEHDYLFQTPVTTKTVWFYNGEMDYGSDLHGIYLFLAIAFILAYILPFTLLATFSSYLLRFKLINKYKQFVDAYGGPFKDNCKFWFGLRLWITIILFLISGALQGNNIRTLFICHHVIIIVFIILQAFIRPFKYSFIGLIDTLTMLNYWFIVEFYLDFKSVFLYAYLVLLTSQLFMILLISLLHSWSSRKNCLIHTFKQRFFNRYRNRRFIEAKSETDSLLNAPEMRNQVDSY